MILIRNSALAGAAAAAFVLASPAAHADWTGKGEAGLLISRGNADSTSANAKLDIARESGDWKNSAFLGFLYGKNAAFTTAQRIEAKYQLDRKISDRMFWFGALRGEQDKFSGFAYQATLATGIGYKFIDNEATKLTGTFGIGYRRLRVENLTKDPATGRIIGRDKLDATGDAVATAGLDFSHALTKTTKIVDKLAIESGSKNTLVVNDIALQVSMTDALALSVGYGVHYNTDPPVGAKKSDTLTTINLVYNIK
jgi:putative salt-induced outer membrane protein